MKIHGIECGSRKELENQIDEIDTILDCVVLGHIKMDAQVRNRLEAKRNGLAVELHAAFPLS